MYGPSDEELREIVEDESSFSINKIEVHDVLSDMDKGSITPKMIALAARVAYEPIIVQHFGSQAAVVEEFGRTVECHVRAGTPKQVDAAGLVVFLCVSLEKKGLVSG
jgi:jasmonate O-methyltransferase